MALEILQTAVGPKGDVYSLQTGGRVVRHGNPKTNDARGEVVYEGKERLDGLWVSPSGALHAVGKRYHTNAGGKWRQEKVPLRDAYSILLSVWAPSDDEVWVGSEEGDVLRLRDGKWTAMTTGLPTEGNFVYVIRGDARGGAVYVGSDEGVAYFDGKKWHAVKMPARCFYQDVLVRQREPSFIVGRDGPNLFAGKGTAWKAVKGLTDDASEDFYSVAGRGKDVYIATGARLIAWNGKTARDAIAPSAKGYLSCLYVSSNDDVVAATSSKGVYASAGEDWTFYPALPADAKKKARPTAPPKKLVAKKKTATADAKRFEFSEGTSNKFWEITVRGPTLTVRFGKIGTEGQTSAKKHASEGDAIKEHDKLIREKQKKGYRLTR